MLSWALAHSTSPWLAGKEAQGNEVQGEGEDGDFLFPAFNKGGLNFKRSLSNHEQNQMVKDCATWLEKAEVDHGIIFLHTSNYLMN